MTHGVFEDLSGQHFGKLTVLYRAADYVQPSGQHKRMWHCKCDCGNECDVRAADLKTGNTRSCGCFQQFSRGKTTYNDLTGRVFGRLTVLYRLPDHVTPSGQHQRIWHCKCKCGNECNVYSSQFKSGKESCGCILKEKKEERAKAKRIESEKRRIKKSENAEKRNLINSEKREKQLKYLEENSLAAKCPNLLSEWDYFQNTISPSEVVSNSSYKAWWIGKCGHKWQTSIARRARGSSCPFCCNQRLLVGFNDLKTTHVELVKEWDYNLNTLNPTDVKASSKEKVWWVCKNGHSYEMMVNRRAGKQKCGCPYCSVPAKRVLSGFNDLKTKYPSLAQEWNYKKNGALKPEGVLCGSAKQVWWIGPCGHEYEQSIVTRVKGANCPYCSRQRLLVGFSDFATVHPELLNEWDYEKNDVLPTAIGVGTHIKIWWKCPFGHSYQAYPSNRCGDTHSGCPICDKENHTSFPEQALYYYIKKCYPDAINSDRDTIGMELDVYIPSLKTAIEYDGRNWHKSNTYELKKNQACKEAGILLMRIREEGLDSYADCYCITRTDVRKDSSLSQVITQVLYDIDKIENIDVNVERDSSAIYSSYIKTRKSQSLLVIYPEIASEWHPSLNGSLSAEMVAPLTNKKVWWLGKCGHEWQMSVQDRTNQNCGCPICSGKRIVSGINDLLTTYPDICKEWDYEKNSANGVFPDKVAPHSDKKAHWKCSKCGYSWFSKIDSRTRMKTGCPECGKRAISASKYKPVECVETGMRFKSLQDAEAETGINRHGISQCCCGKQKTAGGFHWRYSND